MTNRDAIPRLETDRLLLRGHRRDDHAESAAMWADPQVVRHISGTPFSPEESWSRLLRYAGHWALQGFGYWVVEARDDGRFIGEVGLSDFKRDIRPPLDGRPEAGWVLKTAEHGHGFATEAVTRILAWADERLASPETVCIVDPEHAASIAVARKVGFRDEAMGSYEGQPTLIMSRPRP